MKNKSQQDLNQIKDFKRIENNNSKVEQKDTPEKNNIMEDQQDLIQIKDIEIKLEKNQGDTPENNNFMESQQDLIKIKDVKIKGENNQKDIPENSNIKEFVENYNNNKLLKKSLIYSKMDLLRSFLCCRKLKNPNFIAKETIFYQAQAQVYDYMDIINYISLFEKFEKLISILLNESQAISFNFMQNRSISELQTNKISEEIIKQVLDYYKRQINDSSTSLIDYRLIKSFYPSFSDLIQKDSKAE